jgi:hypothetical protein
MKRIVQPCSMAVMRERYVMPTAAGLRRASGTDIEYCRGHLRDYTDSILGERQWE